MSSTNGRSARGRFAKGNPGGPGRPARSVEREYLEATVAGCPLADWRAIVARAVEDAKGGDATARAWLSNILLGRDPVAVRDLVDELRSRLEELNDVRR